MWLFFNYQSANLQDSCLIRDAASSTRNGVMDFTCLLIDELTTLEDARKPGNALAEPSPANEISGLVAL